MPRAALIINIFGKGRGRERVSSIDIVRLAIVITTAAMT